ncbi:alkaline phosphatase PhoX [Methylotetracoccus oryzae]|uniref:alkaline phosphatase PhoX n=1 Tax=Methylotetracoccus oryzae TaxID=1919059 RepID=UPI0013A5329C|nr:alkaline phosphatase PhoX [Methylotetracoccus oryzae]
MSLMLRQAITSALALTSSFAFAAGNSPDFGLRVQRMLGNASLNYFGVEAPLAKSAVDPNGEDTPSRDPGQAASSLITLADGLSARYLTRSAADSTDMMAFWPSDDAPTHIISCVEGGLETLGNGLKNPSVQRIRLSDGKVDTILRGMEGCDGIRLTPWGSILATEETDDGGAYEIIRPTLINDSTITDRTTGTIVKADDAVETRIAKRPALAKLRWEGLQVYPNGVVYFGDELRPGDREDAGGNKIADSDGGAMYKFVPTTPRTGAERINALSDSPLVSGNNYAMRLSCLESGVQYGQGCEVGSGSWVPVSASNAPVDAAKAGATGYYRPEDLHSDPLYVARKSMPNGVRFCWTNTGRADNAHYGEVMCAEDVDSSAADSKVTTQRLLEGDRQLNQPDNLAFQPVTGNVYVIEDNPNGDVWACLRDGRDRDNKSDGCVRMLSVVDASAEPTGFFFSADGTKAYVSIQHSADDNMPLVDGYGTDDVLEISGFKMTSP